MTTLRNLYRLLSPRERRQVLLLLPLLTLTSLAEVAGVASIVPFLTIVADPAAVTENQILARLYDIGAFQDERQFLIAIGIAMFLLIVGSNVMTAFTTWAVLRFSFMRNHTIGLRMLKGYLTRPYSFFIERHSSDLGKNLLMEVNQVVTGVVVPTMQLVARSLATLGILVLLFAIDPLLAALTTLILGGAYGLLFLLIKRRQRRLGSERVRANASRFEIVAEAFGGIKDLKLLGREENVTKRFLGPSYRFASSTAANAVAGQLPRYLFEALAFGGIVLMILYLLGTGRDFQAIVPVLGLYAFGAYRLMPSLQVVFLSLTQIRFNSSVLETLLADLPEVTGTTTAVTGLRPLPLERSIRFVDVNFQYPRAKLPLFQGLDLELPARRSLALVGETGSGKSTLVDLVLGLLEPSGGSIEVDGQPVVGETLRRWQSNIGYVPQSIFLANQSVAQNIAFGLAPEDIDSTSVEDAARAAHIHDFVISELPDGYDTVVGERGVRLSGGQRQRIGIARALYHSPQVIVFDEATSSLDSVTEEAVVQAIEELARDRTVLTIAHRLSTIRGCDRIYLLAAGEVSATGTYDELIATSSAFRSLAKASNDASESEEPHDHR